MLSASAGPARACSASEGRSGAREKKMTEMTMTNGEWLEEIEEALDDLRERRGRIHGDVHDRDLEAEALFDTCERRWRRIERKLANARKHERQALNASRARNVDQLVEAIDEDYYELERMRR